MRPSSMSVRAGQLHGQSVSYSLSPSLVSLSSVNQGLVGIQLKHRIATRETLQSMRKVLITEMSGIYGLLVRANNMPAE